MPLPPLGPFSSEDVAGFLSKHGFTSSPAGLITHYGGDLTYERDSRAYRQLFLRQTALQTELADVLAAAAT